MKNFTCLTQLPITNMKCQMGSDNYRDLPNYFISIYLYFDLEK